jgi:hypothetical protein
MGSSLLPLHADGLLIVPEATLRTEQVALERVIRGSLSLAHKLIAYISFPFGASRASRWAYGDSLSMALCRAGTPFPTYSADISPTLVSVCKL